jgi:curved DNA-binding protein CbpA
MSGNYYQILGVPADATTRQIRVAFRRRARELHPDVSGLDSGPFLKLFEAYSVLSDPEQRRRYDRQLAAAQTGKTLRPTPPAEPLVRARPPAEPFASAGRFAPGVGISLAAFAFGEPLPEREWFAMVRPFLNRLRAR